MPEYQFADKNGNAIDIEYDGKSYMSSSDVLKYIRYAFSLFPYKTTVDTVDGYEDVVRVSYDDNDKKEIYICAKGTTPGGRSGLKDEQRIQPKAKCLNYVYGKTLEGLKGIFMGVYRYDESIILCTWRVSQSTAGSDETPISKQIKISTIAKAFKDGFAQQERGKGEYACAFRPDFLNFYLNNSDWIHNKPVTSLNEFDAEHETALFEFENEYHRAAEYLKNYAAENGIDPHEKDDSVNDTYTSFQQRFSPDKLRQIPDNEICTALFYSAAKTNDSLCYWLEKDKDCREYMGTISGGYAYIFGLFQKSDTGVWMSGSSVKPEELTEEQALERAREIRDAIVAGADVIANTTLDTLEDYEKLDNELNRVMGQWAYRGWIHKYFSMLYPEKLSSFHSSDWQKHILFALRIKPSEKYYARSGQISFVQNCNNWVYYNLSLVIREAFGRVIKFVRLGTTDSNKSYADAWRKRGIVGVGWKDIGSLDEFVTDKLDRGDLAEKLSEVYYPNDSKTASRKAGEIQTFYNSDENTVFVTMDGQTPIGLVDDIGQYTYDPSSDMAHIKKGRWHNSFSEGETLPFKSVGKLTTCYEISDDENLLYLYEKYYYRLDDGMSPEFQEQTMTEDEDNEVMKNCLEIERTPRTSKENPINLIIYGAPGTGKTYGTAEYALKLCGKDIPADRKSVMSSYNDLICDGRVVFTTFHQNYGYEEFIQGLRPDPTSDNIRFIVIDGVFKRIADRALNDPDNNYVIIIDEINRANISKVFGELITLIEDDKRWGEINQLCATLQSGDVFAVPNNLYIVGTMNSADKSISLIDSALRRRFDFVEQKPNPKLISDPVLRDVFEKINKKLVDDLQSTDLLIGHSYFMNKTAVDLPDILNHNVIPLLYEYYYDVRNKVAKTIGQAIADTDISIMPDDFGRLSVK